MFIPDHESIAMVYRLLHDEGLYVGASTALNVVAAVKMAELLVEKTGTAQHVATILCDGAYRYQSRLFSQAWLKSKGLYEAVPEHLRKLVVLQ